VTFLGWTRLHATWIKPEVVATKKYTGYLHYRFITTGSRFLWSPCVIWGQKPNRLLTKERSRTSETRYHRRTNNWQGHTRTQKNTYMNNTDSIKTWIQSWWTGSVSIPYIF
jgi:hypothetical protein